MTKHEYSLKDYRKWAKEKGLKSDSFFSDSEEDSDEFDLKKDRFEARVLGIKENIELYDEKEMKYFYDGDVESKQVWDWIIEVDAEKEKKKKWLKNKFLLKF